jgi:hypothetical protein
VNVTDPDSRSLPVGFESCRATAQAAVNEQQIVRAAEITSSSTDVSQLAPLVTVTLDELERPAVIFWAPGDTCDDKRTDENDTRSGETSRRSSLSTWL